MLSAEYKVFVKSLIKAASEAFFGGGTATAFGGMAIGSKVNIEEGGGIDGMQHVDYEKMKCYVQITDTVKMIGQVQPLLAKFAIAHEFGHIVAGPIGGEIGTAEARLDSKKHEVAADLIGTCLLLRTGVTPIMITTMLQSYGDYVMDEVEKGTHPSRKDRMAYIISLFPKIRSGGGSTELDAIKNILKNVP